MAERNRASGKLKIRCAVAIILVGLLFGSLLTVAGIHLYSQQTLSSYNELGIKAANIVAGYFSDDDIVKYANLVNGYVNGTVSRDELTEAANSDKYKETNEKLFKLREQLGFNDLLACVIDINVLENYEGEDKSIADGKSIRYIMDSHVDPDKRVRLGATDWVHKATRDKLIQVCHGNNDVDSPFVSKSKYGHVITSVVPIKVKGVNVAFVFAEFLVDDYEKDIWRFVLWTALISAMVVLVLVLISIRVISRHFVKPILSIVAETGKFVSDNTRVSEKLKDIKTGDEIELLAKSILKMEIDTEKYIENLMNVTAEEERIKSELDVATHIQADMLPSIFPPFPDRNEFSMTASMLPAKEVGGDFYDFFLVDENHLGLVMADVSGKGVPAALFMVIAKTLIKDKAILDGSEGDYSTSAVLQYVNEQLCDNNKEGFFVTVWFAILDLTTGKGIESNAGHEYPAICRNGGKYELIKRKHSPAVATYEGIKFRENSFQLNPGDALYVYTDGVTEATNAEGELFGEQRLVESLNSNISASTTEVLKIVKKDVDKFVAGAPQFDDITMLSFKYYGKKEEAKAVKQMILKANVDNLQQALDFVEQELDLRNCGIKVKNQILVAAEEIFVNVASYAYEGSDGEVEIKVSFDADSGVISIVFIDSGVKYDPLEKKDPDTKLSADERPIGGLGIYMTKKFVDELIYDYENGKNILTMKKKI